MTALPQPDHGATHCAVCDRPLVDGETADSLCSWCRGMREAGSYAAARIVRYLRGFIHGARPEAADTARWILRDVQQILREEEGR